jgi:hypothetical protein
MKIKELIAKLQQCHPNADCSFQYYESVDKGWTIKLYGESLQENRSIHSVTFAFVISKETNNG